MKRIVFYSWQSDLDGKGNRNLIEESLNRALKEIRRDENESIEPVLDRDTSGLQGSPSISESILNKISLSDIFVADVSIINANSEEKKTPNPNVLIELGYAVSQLGWDRVIMVMNTFYGGPEELPFDLRGRRVVAYSMNPECDSKSVVRGLLQGRMESYLRDALDDSQNRGLPSGANTALWWGLWHTDSERNFGGKLFIRETSSGGFLFDLNVWNGAHVGFITGVAVFVSRDAAYARIKHPDSDEFGELSFRRRVIEEKRFIKVDETINCQYWRGMGVLFNGDFSCYDDYLFLLGYLNEMDLQRLYMLMGDYYFEFKSVMEIISETNSTDDFNSRVYHGGVRGLFTISEGIIMCGDYGEFWVAYLKDNKVHYFTNMLEWKKNLPKTIEDWRKRFSSLDVSYNIETTAIPKKEQW